jgi:DNA-binding transcriptional ArsR family regulator
MKTQLDFSAETAVVSALAALAQTSRLRVFRLLVGAGPSGLCPGQIAETLEIPANSLSFHLKELHHAGLIYQQREGRFLRYRADMPAMKELIDFMTAHCCNGERCAGMPELDCAATTS